MTGLPWYRREPEAFIEGVSDMSLEEVGAYALLIDHMYMKGGPIKDAPTFIAGLLGVDVRVWNRVRAALLRKGKITQTGDGMLFNRRVSDELDNQHEVRKKRAKAGRVSGQKRAERQALSFSYEGDPIQLAEEAASVNVLQRYSDAAKALKSLPIAATHAEHVNEQNRTERDRDREYYTPSNEGVVGKPTPAAQVLSFDKDVFEAVRLYVEAAKRAGWTGVRGKISGTRKKHVLARLRAEGGLDGWRAQIALAERQPFLGGTNDRGWCMDFDFFVSERGWTKIAEGAYLRKGDVIVQREDDGLGEWRAYCKIRTDSGAWPKLRSKRGPDGERLPFSPEMVPPAVRAAFPELFANQPSLFVVEGGR
jgi:uncharacterized protein YdaU (DUF1376 family)